MSAVGSSSDVAVQQTATDAISCKVSIASLGYVDDPFAHELHPRSERRPPLINRGYYARVAAVDTAIQQFLACSSVPPQIISLGAGKDTTFFKLQARGVALAAYVEVDFPEVVREKVMTIRRRSKLRSALGEPTDRALAEAYDVATLRAGVLHMVGADMRDVEHLEAKLAACGVDWSLPTLLLAECVLVYMEPDQGTALVQWAGRRFDVPAFLAYDPIRPHDAFGKTMVQNLNRRGCSLRSIAAFPDLEQQAQRYRDAGFEDVRVRDMDDVYYLYLESADVARVERIEMLDELEEWHLILRHYCFVVAVKARLAGVQFLKAGTEHSDGRIPRAVRLDVQ